MAAILPVETIEIEILPRLPVKSLLRFKSVCKSWSSLISSDVFIKSVRNSNYDSFTLIRERVQYFGRDYSTRVLGCINGLVFIESSNVDFKELRFFTIWNRQCLEFDYDPYPHLEFEEYDEFRGFGFDSVPNDYKLMHVIIVKEGRPLVGYIYSCNAGSWSEITQSNFIVPAGYINNRFEPVIVNGSPSWLIKQYCDGKKSRLIVMSFDVEQEFFRLLPDLGSSGSIPKDELREFYELLNFRDSLAVMFYSLKLWFGETIDIHIFNEKCDDWSKTSFGPFKFLSKVPNSHMEPLFLQCLSNGDILFVDNDIKELYWVNLENYTIKRHGEGGDLCYVYNYSESLVFINGMNPFYEKEDWFQFFILKKDQGAATEEICK